MKKRILSLFMACCMLFGSIVFSPTVSSEDSLVFTDHSGMFGAHLLSRTEISQNDDGSFDVLIDMYTYYAMLKENRSVTGSVDDFYVVDRDGTYLVELWGGDGASLGGASGGLGGYTRGIVELQVGDIIFYTLGGAGTVGQSANTGGGANGGGNRGPSGSTVAGGGGGYSAAFLYKNGAEADGFYATYTDSDKHLIHKVNEADRLSKYIMIAGGGGGAGSGGNNKRAEANGGDGGYDALPSGTLSTADGYPVSGTFYAGSGGSSTNGTGERGGRGGTNQPGSIASSAWGLSKGSQPNDWGGSQNAQLIGGAGGDGNHGGGAGGAGFAGGSGGVVDVSFFPTDVGGGGGGSSFIGTQLNTTLTAEATNYSIGRDRASQRSAELAEGGDGRLGGFFHIVYLEEDNVDYLKNLTVKLARTPFFTVTNFEAVNLVNGEPFEYMFDPNAPAPIDGEPSRIIAYDSVVYNLANNSYSEGEGDLNALRFTIPNVSLMPNTRTGDARDHLTIRMTFVPKDDFAGGNNVPLFAGSKIRCKPADQNEHTEHITGEVDMRNYCGYVNVPLKLDPAPVNHTPQGLDPANTKHPVSSLFIDRYAAVRDHYSDYWRYFFLSDISDHLVEDEDGNKLSVKDEQGNDVFVSPDETTRYRISLTATAKPVTGKNYARLGEVSTTKTFTGISLVTIIGSGIEPLGQNMVVYEKSLNLVNGEYVLSLHVSSDSSGSIRDENILKPLEGVASGGTKPDGSPSSSVITITIPYAGSYEISLKGAKGGKGGAASLSLGDGAKGGDGGPGANLTATYEFDMGIQLRFFAGETPVDSGDNLREGGLGGKPSYVAVLDTKGQNIEYYLMIAAGGPGGGGASIALSSGGNGAQPTEVIASAEKILGTADISGYAGASGESGTWFNPGNGGQVGKSYVYAGSGGGVSYVAPDPSLGNNPHNAGTTPAGTLAGGTGSIDYGVLTDTLSGDGVNLGKYKLVTAISKYFTVTKVTLSDETAGGEPVVTTLDKTVTRYDGNFNHPLDENDPKYNDYTYQSLTNVVELTPQQLGGSDGVTHIEFTYKIHLVPRVGFLGGNDVKLIEPAMATTGLLTGMTLGYQSTSDFINIDEDRSLDYANVPIDTTLLEDVAVTTQNKTYVYGDTLYMKDLVAKDENGNYLCSLPDLSGYAWEADYLTLVDPTLDNTLLTPEENTTYPIYAGVAPTVSNPYSNTDGEVSPLVKEYSAEVVTEFSVTFELNHIEPPGKITPDAEGRYLIPFIPDGAGGYVAENDYVFTLTASPSGDDRHSHHLPKSITVTVDDHELKAGTGRENGDYIYNRGYDTGTPSQNLARAAEVTIFADRITGNVVVSAAACEEHHALYYVYQDSPDSTTSKTLTLTQKHYSEHVDPEEDFRTMGATLPADTATHTFEWVYGDLDIDTNGHYIMPKGEAWITGHYTPRNFTVTVTYVDESGNELHAPTSVTLPYGSDYHIPSPAIGGYKPNRAALSGNIGASDETFEVVYTEAKGLLTIHYVYADGSKAADSYSEQWTSGSAWEPVTSPQIFGYTPSTETVSGVMDDDGETFTVTYTPKTFTVTFVADCGEGPVTLETRTVEYGNLYAYDAALLADRPFPIPFRLGYTFEGWERGGLSVKASDTVHLSADTTLVARFRIMSFTLTLRYQSTNLDGITYTADPITPTVINVDAGASYDVALPTLTGFRPDAGNRVTGKMPAQNLVILVTYVRNEYTVTVHYDMPSGAPTLPDKSVPLLHGADYRIVSPTATEYPALENFKPNLAVVEGTVNAENVYVTVTYYSTAISVDIAWGAMNFSYDLGVWDPQTHTYSGGSFTPMDDSNTVTVTNNTVGKNVVIGYGFLVNNVYAGISGYYTDSHGETITESELGTSQSDKTATAYFTLEDNESLGALALPDRFVAGTCTLTIREVD